MTLDKQQLHKVDHPEEAEGGDLPEVEGYSAQAVERLRRFIAADEAHSEGSGEESMPRQQRLRANHTDEEEQDRPAGA